MVLGFSGLGANAVIGLLSIIFLVYAADVVVEKMQAVAKAYGISEVFIAMTIVSLGTSLPEILLHIVASFKILLSSGPLLELLNMDITSFLLESHTEAIRQLIETGASLSPSESVYMQQSGTVLGASIGSDVVQETLVIGLVIISSAVLAGRKGFRFTRKFLIRDYAPMVGTTFILMFLALNWKGLLTFLTGGSLNVSGTLTRLDGLILVALFLAYMYYQYTTRDEKLAQQGDMKPSKRPLIDLSVGLGMMLLLIGSADIFLRVVEVAIAETGLSGSMIGVATVGVVSAFPEMITAITGLRQGSEGLSLGTLIGSNITNPLLAIGSGAVISTYAVPRPLVLWDLPMEILFAGLPVVYMFFKEDIGRILAKPARKAGMTATAEKLEGMENKVLSVAGAVFLILLYFMYLYVRFTYFQYDFVN